MNKEEAIDLALTIEAEWPIVTVTSFEVNDRDQYQIVAHIEGSFVPLRFADRAAWDIFKHQQQLMHDIMEEFEERRGRRRRGGA